MGFPVATTTTSSIVSSDTDSIKPGGQSPQIGPPADNNLFKGMYQPIPSNWYTAKPYGFKFTSKSKPNPIIMFLPISPSNLTIATNFATNVVPTLYGTVEEHSPVRYYDIVIEGTTGMGPKYVDPGSAPVPSKGRKSFSVQQGLANSAGGFLNKTLSTVDKVIQATNNLVKGTPPAGTGLFTQQTGYIAFHNLYRFLLKYKEDCAGLDKDGRPRENHPLTFFNYKDNNEYKVVIRNFILRRSQEDPMLYFYSITMRGYDLSTVSNKIPSTDQKALLAALGLDGVQNSSAFSEMKQVSDNVKGILGPLGAGINILGR